jgi:hypothetical protein
MGTADNAVRREPWSKGTLVGQKAAFKLKDIWALRVRVQMEGWVRELALFHLRIDSKLRGCDLVGLKFRDICHGDQVAARAFRRSAQDPAPFSSRSRQPPETPCKRGSSSLVVRTVSSVPMLRVPAPVYSAPAPMYYEPAPRAYYRPPPPVYYRPAPVYDVHPAPEYWRGERWRHRHHHRDWDDRGDRDYRY